MAFIREQNTSFRKNGSIEDTSSISLKTATVPRCVLYELPVMRMPLTFEIAQAAKSQSRKMLTCPWQCYRKDTIMKIGDMFLGLTDANSEYSQIGDDEFLRLFCAIPGFDMEKIRSGSVSFICGDKGTGKTMLLRYAELMAKRDACPTAFIKYKRDVNDRETRRMSQAGNESRTSEEFVVDSSSKSVQSKTNYVLGWQLYLIKVVVFLINRSESYVFDRGSEEWSQIVGVLEDLYGKSGGKRARMLLPRITKGQVELKSKHASLLLDLEPPAQDACRIQFSEAAQGIVDLYSELPCNPESDPVYVFIDEIELAYGKKSEYERSVSLIRDLIVSVSYLNDIARENAYPIRIVMALRNEVFRSVKNTGYELNKPIEDFGLQVSWRAASKSIDASPLLNIVEKRIAYNNPDENMRASDVWSTYFPESVDGTPVKQYVLNQTWSKPRDVIRLLRTLQEKCLDDEMFREQAFYDIRKDYSRKAWSEIEEEIRTNYSDDFVDGIRRLLGGMECPFGVGDLTEKLGREADSFENAAKLRESKSPSEILDILFKFGIIGNVRDRKSNSGRSRFIAYGEDEPDIYGVFTIHYPLRSMFDVRDRGGEPS